MIKFGETITNLRRNANCRIDPKGFSYMCVCVWVKWVPFGNRASVSTPHTTKIINFPYGNDLNRVARPHKVPLGDKAPNKKNVKHSSKVKLPI